MYDNISFMPRYSERAKKGLRRQINAQIRFLKGIVASKEKELKKAKRYARYKLPGYKIQIKRIENGITIAKRDLRNAQARKRKLQKEGKI